ncbi:MAG: bifunctional glutamate N-acetyltransferase/amino-acid acetyltransferase ArgJ [Chloroflexi bacterium]|nr:MAG: bifunctional glutamate N-acetyltransferase/amino-acid acetyltransferase ArgJ [Chloroflexota bacterium]
MSGTLLDSSIGARRSVLEPLESRLPTVTRRAVMPAGFRAAAATVGIKLSGRPDLALIVTGLGRDDDPPVPAAAIFTTNSLPAAPVRLSQDHLARTLRTGSGSFGWTRAIVATSGSANAATGHDGDADQAAIAGHLASALGVQVEQILALSTGIIGSRLPVDRITAGIDRLAPEVNDSDDALEAFAAAICTTDSRIKVATTSVPIEDADGTRAFRVSGVAKGVGMIHPRMATMLAAILTDAPAQPATLDAILRAAASTTWNQLSVDGDTSTNDTVFLLASGAAGGPAIQPGSPSGAALARAVEAVARDLARQQAADGEGATTLLTCQVSGAREDAEARALARSVVSSSLVKAAVHGRDPNWGRIAAAAGNAGIPIDPDRLRIAIAGTLVFDGSVSGAQAFDRETVRAAMDAPELLVRVDLGVGDGVGEAFGCDLTEAYVIENSEYTT